MDDYQVYEMNEPSNSPNNSKTNIGCFTWVFGVIGILVLISEIAKLFKD